MAHTTSRKHLLHRLALGIVAAVVVFMMQSGPEKAMAEKEAVYTVSQLVALAHNTPPM